MRAEARGTEVCLCVDDVELRALAEEREQILRVVGIDGEFASTREAAGQDRRNGMRRALSNGRVAREPRRPVRERREVREAHRVYAPMGVEERVQRQLVED